MMLQTLLLESLELPLASFPFRESISCLIVFIFSVRDFKRSRVLSQAKKKSDMFMWMKTFYIERKSQSLDVFMLKLYSEF